MPEPDEELQRALALAYAYLNRRERTVNEMRAYLERHGIQTAAVAGAVATLSEHGALDDARFVRLFAQDKRELEDWGSERIRRTLLARGVDRDLIDDSLRDGEDGGEDAGDGGERRRALALLSRRFPT